MLENWRYNCAPEANKRYPDSGSRDIFLEQKYLTRLALDRLGVKDAVSPSEVSKVGSLFMAPELIPGLRIPYVVEVLGMPGAGKSMMINRYLEELWLRNERNKVALVDEGAQTVKLEYGDLRYTDPFSYSLLAGTATFVNYIASLENINSGMKMVVSKRGQIDRRVFRRALFSRGDVAPTVMEDEGQFINGLENTPVQVGGIVMLMVRPEKAVEREKNIGPVTNADFLARLYEQYWRLHWELLQGEIPYRIYTCIDAEEPEDKVYERFKYAMGTALNIHSIYLAALARTFPGEFDRAKTEADKHPRRPSKVLIVGRDDMESEDEALEKPLIEVLRLK